MSLWTTVWIVIGSLYAVAMIGWGLVIWKCPMEWDLLIRNEPAVIPLRKD